MNPRALEMDDVTHIFFEHTNLGSNLADLGHECLVAKLDGAHEGSIHNYVIPSIALHPLLFFL